MADEFLVFSEVLCRLTEEEEKWLRHQLEWVVVIDGKEYQESEAPEDGNEEWSGCRGWMDFENGEPSGEIESCFEFHDNDKVGWGRYMWVHAEEFGDPEAVAHLIQNCVMGRRYLPQQRRPPPPTTAAALPCTHRLGRAQLGLTETLINAL